MNRSAWATLALLRGGGRLGRRDAVLALDHELGEPADVLGGSSGRDLDDPLGDRVDEVAVVADEQDRAGPRLQVLLEPRHGLDVEVVGRLVEHQEVGRGRASGGPSATRMRQPPDRSSTGRSLSPGANPRPARMRCASDSIAVAAEGLEPVLGLAVGLERLVVGVGVGIGAADAGLGHVDREPVELLLQIDQVGGAPEDLVEDRAVDLLGQLLGQVPDPGVLADVHLAVVGLLDADDDLEDRGLADAVAADERDTSTRHQLGG